MDKEKIFVFDTTLRDGEQAAGLRLDSIEKLEIACPTDKVECGYNRSRIPDFFSGRF